MTNIYRNKNVKAYINDMLTLGGIENYSDLHLIHPDGSTDKPGVEGVSHVLLVRKGTKTAKQLDQIFKRKRRAHTPNDPKLSHADGNQAPPANGGAK